MFKLALEKRSTSVGLSKKQESSRKISTSASLTTLEPLTVDHNKLEKFFFHIKLFIKTESLQYI